MTMQEVSERYHIPMEVLRAYESWGLCGAVKTVLGAWQYDAQDLERLGVIMTLRDLAFTNEEIKMYMRLLLEGNSTEAELLRLLKEKRGRALDEIYFKETQLERLDYLRYEIQKASKSRTGDWKGG